MEVGVFSRMRTATPATLLVASFALSFLLQRIYEMLFTNNVQTAAVAPELARSINIGGIRIQMLSVATIIIAAVLLFALLQFLNRSIWGLQLQAAAADFRTARLVGIPASRVIGLSFALSGILAAAVAFVSTVQTGAVGPTFGVPIVILALIGAVIGGIDKIYGALAGGFLVGFVTSMLASWLPSDMSNFKDAYVFLFVIIVLIFRPNGLLVRGGTVRT